MLPAEEHAMILSGNIREQDGSKLNRPSKGTILNDENNAGESNNDTTTKSWVDEVKDEERE